MSVMTPTHQPMGSPSSSQYLPRTWEPMPNASQGSRAGTGSGLALLGAAAEAMASVLPTGAFGAALAGEGAAAPLSAWFVFCSCAGLVPEPASFVAFGELAAAALAACSSMRL